MSDSITVQYLDYPPAGEPRGWYVTDPDYEEIIAGPFATSSEAERALRKYLDNHEPPERDTFDADEAADIRYRQDMKDAGRGHLLK